MAANKKTSVMFLSREDAAALEHALPFLPGHCFPVLKPNYHKNHAFEKSNGVSVVNDRKDDGQEVSTGTGKRVPAWIAYDRKVKSLEMRDGEGAAFLRLLPRKCVGTSVHIYFYLEDDSIHVSEPKTPNSGLPQGVILRRHRIPLAESSTSHGKHFVARDFNVGSTVEFYSRSYRIIGCDEFTKNFLTQQLGLNVPSESAAPTDPFQAYRAVTTQHATAPRSQSINPSLKKFLQYDRQVLRFFCVWDDCDQGGVSQLRHLALHYFLADDTIEITEITSSHKTVKFLNRARLPKPKSATSQSAQFYSDTDLIIGSVISVHGRLVVLCDGDEFTKNYFADVHGVCDFHPIPLVHGVHGKDTAAAQGDAHSINNPNPSTIAPPASVRKMPAEWAGLVLRFVARLESTKKIDQERTFVICYFLEDGTFQIYERHLKNSGISGGTFMERSRYQTDKPSPYSIKDLVIDAHLMFHAHNFVLTDFDEFTRKFMAANADRF